MKWAAAASVLLATGAALGTYFALRGGPSVPPVPKAERSAILEEAKTEGVIVSYRPVLVDLSGHFARWRYNADGGDVEIWHEGGFRDVGYTVIQYRRSALEKAAAIRDIVRRESPHVKIIFGPPFDN